MFSKSASSLSADTLLKLVILGIFVDCLPLCFILLSLLVGFGDLETILGFYPGTVSLLEGPLAGDLLRL